MDNPEPCRPVEGAKMNKSNSLSTKDFVAACKAQGVVLLAAAPLTQKQIILGKRIAKKHGLLKP